MGDMTGYDGSNSIYRPDPLDNIGELFLETKKTFPSVTDKMRAKFQPDDQDPCDNYGCKN